MIKVQRPANEVILDDVDLRNLLKISERTTAALRAKNMITYCPGSLNSWTKLVNQFSHLNLGYEKTTQKLFCGTEASNYPGSRPGRGNTNASKAQYRSLGLFEIEESV